MDTNEHPLDRAVHYVIAHAQSQELGKTKLNKVLWRADLEHYRRYGRSVTRLENYSRLQYGPVPHTINLSLRRLVDCGRISIPAERGLYSIIELQALDQIATENFTASEIECLQEAIRHVTKMTAQEASEETHDILWEEIGLGCDISIGAASIKALDLDPEDFLWAAKAEAA
jgi:hypothetical protein